MPSFFAPFSTFLRNDTPFLRIERKKTHPIFVIPRFLPYLCKEIWHEEILFTNNIN